MNRFSQEHLTNDLLRREIQKDETREGEVTAFRLARIAEYDGRKLYLEDAFPSMFAWCMGELRLSVEESKKRIRIARAGRRCPVVFEALADGRVNLSGMVCLAAHLTPETAEELVSAAAHRTRAEIERLLAERFPKAEIAASVEPIAPGPQQLGVAEGSPGTLPGAVIPGQDEPRSAPMHTPNRVSQLSAESFAVQFTRGRKADERFRYLQSLLGHQVSRSDIAEVYARAVEALITKMERVRFGATDKPRKAGDHHSSDPRHVSAETKRTVWIRDGGQCTFVSESGRRCEACGDVQYDHVTPVAKGGQSTVDNLRLRCHGHNQHAAEQAFGAGFMKQKREEAKAAKERARTEKAAAKAERDRLREEKEREARLLPHEEEVVPWVCALGIRESEARIAAKRCREMAGARLEDRVKRALTFFGDRVSRRSGPASALAVCAP